VGYGGNRQNSAAAARSRNTENRIMGR
jgi:hypothetical protein